MDSTNTILSVGIDIGTSTTQVIFSRIAMENTAGYFSIPKVSIVDKEVVYRSGIYTTPLLDRSRIDGDRVRDIVAAEFQKAGFTPADTGTGAVIITGESARKENSALVLEKLSGFAGEFVVSTAGPDLEAIIAGKGSGAQQYSEEMCCTAVNLDIGGGTTNLVLFDCGRTVGKGCLDIGGRLIRLEPDYTVTYLSPAAALVAESRGVPLREGERASLADLKEVCRGMAQLLEECLGLSPPSPLLRRVQTPGSSWLDLAGQKPVRAIFFSGGVADGVYRGLAGGDDPIPYGDIGLLLGEAIREGRLCTAFRLEKGKETIRAQKNSDLKNRLAMMTADPTSVAVSIHLNKFPQSRVKGAQVFYAPRSQRSELLAQTIQDNFRGLLQPDNTRQIKKADNSLFLLYNNTVTPAVLVECGFLSNPEEAALLASEDYQDKVAFAICWSLLQFYDGSLGDEYPDGTMPS